MQQFIANGRVSDIPEDAVGRTANGNVSLSLISPVIPVYRGMMENH